MELGVAMTTWRDIINKVCNFIKKQNTGRSYLLLLLWQLDTKGKRGHCLLWQIGVKIMKQNQTWQRKDTCFLFLTWFLFRRIILTLTFWSDVVSRVCCNVCSPLSRRSLFLCFLLSLRHLWLDGRRHDTALDSLFKRGLMLRSGNTRQLYVLWQPAMDP